MAKSQAVCRRSVACSWGAVACDGKRQEEMLVVGAQGSDEVSPADIRVGKEGLLVTRTAQSGAD